MVPTTAPTRYEITLKHADGREFLVCYCAGSPSRRALIRVISERSRSILSAAGFDPDNSAPVHIHKAPHWSADIEGTAWRIAFTGRTQREIKNSGGVVPELPFIGTNA